MSDTTNRIAGVAYLTVDGNTYLLRGELSYRVSKVKRDTITGQDRVHGFSELPLPGQIKCKLTDSGKFSVADINAMSNVTVTCELANGKTIVGKEMWTVDSQDVDTTEASFDVVWESDSVIEA